MKLISYNDSYYKHIQDFQINASQLQFTIAPLDNIRLAKQNPNRHCILGLSEQNDLVVFFVLHEDSEFTNYFSTTPETTIFVRSLSTDERHLRQGYAKKSLALLDTYLLEHMPHIKHIALLVDKPNQIAYKLYISLGFEDVGVEVNNDGDMQLLMEKSI